VIVANCDCMGAFAAAVARRGSSTNARLSFFALGAGPENVLVGDVGESGNDCLFDRVGHK
jgi:hypothetical protein